MENKHTQGNWNVSKSINDYTIYSDDDSSKDIATAYQYSRNIPENEAQANAKLIAAAPDMLNALLTIHSNFKANSNFGTLPNKQELEAGLRILETAIEKATL